MKFRNRDKGILTITFVLALYLAGTVYADLTATEGLSIDLSSAGAGTDMTIAFDPTELTGNRTFGDGSTDTITWTWRRATGTNPIITFGNGALSTNSTWAASSFIGALTGNADTVTTNANLTGEVTSVGNAAVIIESFLEDGGASEIAVTAGMMNAGTSASASTFWRGDNTWVTPAGAGDMAQAIYDVLGNSLVDGADVALATNWDANPDATSKNTLYDAFEQLSINVKTYGAIGDYVVASDTGTDDTAAINTAIAAANDGPIKMVYFPPGNYRTTTPLVIPTDATNRGRVRLVGNGRDATFIYKNANTVGSGSNTARAGVVTDSYAVDAIIIIEHPDNAFSEYTTIRDMSLMGTKATSDVT
ncbi:hypothetical protein LCGC14_2970740, partial [marine sediment metagenome]